MFEIFKKNFTLFLSLDPYKGQRNYNPVQRLEIYGFISQKDDFFYLRSEIDKAVCRVAVEVLNTNDLIHLYIKAKEAKILSEFTL